MALVLLYVSPINLAARCYPNSLLFSWIYKPGFNSLASTQPNFLIFLPSSPSLVHMLLGAWHYPSVHTPGLTHPDLISWPKSRDLTRLVISSCPSLFTCCYQPRFNLLASVSGHDPPNLVHEALVPCLYSLALPPSFYHPGQTPLVFLTRPNLMGLNLITSTT